MTRNRISISNEGARPHSQELSTNSSTEPMNSRTAPKRWVSQPVSGTEMALATAKLVMTQVPWLGETPRSPAIAGSATLAIEVSRTFMNTAADRHSVPQTREAPVSGAWPAVVGRLGGGGAGVDAAAPAAPAVPDGSPGTEGGTVRSLLT